MKEIHGSASAVVPAPPKECFALLAAVDRYDEWNGELVRELEVLERDPPRLRAVIHVKQSPFMKTFSLQAAVATEPRHAVHITRIPNGPGDHEAMRLVWRIAPADAGSRIELDFSAAASFVPGFFPLGGVGNLIAGTLLESAVEALGR